MVDLVTISILASSVFFVVLSFALLVRYKQVSVQISSSNDLGHDLWGALESRLKKQDERILDMMGRVDVIQSRMVERQVESAGNQSVLGHDALVEGHEAPKEASSLQAESKSQAALSWVGALRRESATKANLGFLKSLDSRLTKQDECLGEMASKLQAIQVHLSEAQTKTAAVQTTARPLLRVQSRESTVKVDERILMNMLAESPRTSVEIRERFGITREHAARILKEFFDKQLVARNDSHKPFIYELTEEGRRRISE